MLLSRLVLVLVLVLVPVRTLALARRTRRLRPSLTEDADVPDI
jgi:hypothetical protein